MSTEKPLDRIIEVKQELYDDAVAKKNGQISTSSPAGIAAASAVTPDKLANLLLTQGPLAIRHLTSHLANIIPGFSHLSLSKQRRLIISCLDSGDVVTGCVFEKVGWGQWAAKKVGSEYVKAMQEKINQSANHNISDESEPVIKLGHKSQSPPAKKPSESFGWKNRRESITTKANDPHLDIIPKSPSLTAKKDEDEDAIASSSDDDSDSEEETDSLNNKFQYNEIKPARAFQQRSHSQLTYSSSPLLGAPPMRRHRSLFNSPKGITKPKVRSRLGSFNTTAEGYENVDDITEFRKNHRSSFNGLSIETIESYVRGTSLPSRMSISNLTNSHNVPLFKSSNTTTVASSNSPSYHSDTDEEDWESMGAASLRRNSTNTVSENNSKKSFGFKEEAAAYALVNLSAA